MSHSVISKNLKGSTELTLIADIRSGFVELPDPMSYGTRLQKLLGTLFDSRKEDVEEDIAFLGPLERLRTIHFVRFAVFDQRRRLLLAVSFDRPWEPYIRHIVDEAGPLLDIIFSHCVGYEGHACRDGYLKFAEWVHARQEECDFFFSAFPGQTVDDIHYLRNLRRELTSLAAKRREQSVGATAAAEGEQPRTLTSLPLDARVGELSEPSPGPAEYGDFFRSAVGLYRLRNYFPANVVADPAYADQAVFDRACRAVLGAFGSFPQFPSGVAEQYRGLDAWYGALSRPPSDLPVPRSRPAEGHQDGILRAHEEGGKPMTHGCAVLLQFQENPVALLNFMAKHCAFEPEDRAGPQRTRYNIGFTPQGLRKLGLSEQTLGLFPLEFIEGMAARAGLLGDVGSNHPSTWRLPKINYEKETGLELQLTSVDAVVIVQKRIEHDEIGDHLWSMTHPLADDVRRLATHGVTLLHVQALRRYDSEFDPRTRKSREHFGFLDGFGQPELASDGSRPAPNEVARGEIFLGQPNDSGEIPGDSQPLLSNGSFLVLRKLAQDVAAFRKEVGPASRPLAEKMVGRTAAGNPLAQPNAVNEWFDYSADPLGEKCPLQAHARLANPRSPEARSAFGRPERTPRILRRGFAYGPLFSMDEQAERGLLFMAYNASISQQYEVIQRWLNGANGTGLDSSQRDPLTGAVDAEGGQVFRYRDRSGVRCFELPARPFAKLEWGMYLFVPSVAGLCALREPLQKQLDLDSRRAAGGNALSPDLQALLGRGQELLAGLLGRNHPYEWKQVLEEQGSRDQSFAVLAAIRANHRVLRTPLGVLVVGAQEALEVLTQEEKYSVREYWRRMSKSHMQMYLGMDAAPKPRAVCPMHPATGRRLDQDYVDNIGKRVDYLRESIANGYLAELTRVEGFLTAIEVTERAIATSIEIERAAHLHVAKLTHATLAAASQAAKPLRVSVDLYILAERVISALSQIWFALPDGEAMLHGGQPNGAEDPKAYCPADFAVFSQYVFRAQPDELTEQLSTIRGSRVTQATARYLQNSGPTFQHRFLAFLREKTSPLGLEPDEEQELIVRSVVGTVDGFVAASFGSFLSVVGQWLNNDDFWRIQRKHEAVLAPALRQQLKEAPPTAGEAMHPLDDTAAFVLQVCGTLKLFPKPAWLHRVALEDTDLGNVRVRRGERVFIHLGQAALEQPGPSLLFGGQYDELTKFATGPERTPVHACPAREVAMGVLLGMLVSVLQLKNVRLESTLAITFEA